MMLSTLTPAERPMLVVLETSKVATSVAPLGTVFGRPVGGRVPIAVRGVKVPCGAAGMEDGGSREGDYAGRKEPGLDVFSFTPPYQNAPGKSSNFAICAYGTTASVRSFASPPLSLAWRLLPSTFTSARVDRESLKTWRRRRRLRFDFKPNRSFCICLAGQRRGSHVSKY